MHIQKKRRINPVPPRLLNTRMQIHKDINHSHRNLRRNKYNNNPLQHLPVSMT